MARKVTPFLMFEGEAEAAMEFYMSLFENAGIRKIEKFGAEGPGRDGSVLQAIFVLAGQEVIFFDSPSPHDFTFTPSFSFFVDCENEAEIDRVFAALSEGGKVMMPLDDYGFSHKFGWAADRFGVSWQLNWGDEN